MHTDTTYNGWKNRTTWAVALWMGSDEDTYRQVQALADTRGVTAADLAAWTRANWADLPTLARIDIGADLSAVDWAAILAGFRE